MTIRTASLFAALTSVVFIGLTHWSMAQDGPGWKSMFNGKDLTGWTPKIRGYESGNNFANTFRVNDGVLQVNYDGYGGKFQDRFGHLFFNTEFSNYIIRLDYRFTGNQMPDGAGWAFRNSGIMIHGQSPTSMTKDQDFPVSVEVQLLGGPKEGVRHTLNMCSPGTNIVRDGKLITQHCVDSNSETYRGDQWVHAEVEVHGRGLIIHRIDGKEVMRYEQAQYDPKDPNAKRLIKDPNKLLIDHGTISLQSESHPCEFRNIRIKELRG